MKNVCIPSALASALLIGGACAQTVSYTDEFSFIPTNSQVLSIQQFDPSLGTLNSVFIKVDLTKSGGSLYVDNDSDTGASGEISQSVIITLTSDVGLIVNGGFTPYPSISVTSTYMTTVGADDGDGGVANAKTEFQPGGPDYAGTSFGIETATFGAALNPLVNGQFQGTGTINLTASGSQSSETGSVGGLFYASGPATVSGVVTVYYNYTPATIPEPTTALLGGLSAVALLRRRRN